MAARKEVRPAKNPKGFRQRFLPPQVPRANARKRRRASFPATLGGPLVGPPSPGRPARVALPPGQAPTRLRDRTGSQVRHRARRTRPIERARQQERLALLCRHRLREEVTLGSVTAKRCQALQRPPVLDPLRRGDLVQAARHADHRTQDRLIVHVLAHVHDEAAVYFHLVKGHFPKPGERRVASPEVVYRKVDTERAQLPQDFPPAFLSDRAFSELEAQSARLEVPAG